MIVEHIAFGAAVGWLTILLMFGCEGWLNERCDLCGTSAWRGRCGAKDCPVSALE